MHWLDASNMPGANLSRLSAKSVRVLLFHLRLPRGRMRDSFGASSVDAMPRRGALFVHGVNVLRRQRSVHPFRDSMPLSSQRVHRNDLFSCKDNDNSDNDDNGHDNSDNDGCDDGDTGTDHNGSKIDHNGLSVASANAEHSGCHSVVAGHDDVWFC